MFALCSVLATSVMHHAHEEKSFLSWMRETNNFFNGEDYNTRFGIWMANKRIVNEHNAAGEFKLAMNHLSHLTSTEYRSLLGHRSSQNLKIESSSNEALTVDSYDWREKGIVNAVKDQGQCGSCWTFSVVQAQESQWALKKGDLLSLSEQNIVDCCTAGEGCNGGDEYPAYEYVIKHQDGLWMLESDYPYTAHDGKCKFNKAKGVTKTVSCYRPSQGDETKLANGLVTGGVVSIAIDASHYSFQLYNSGVYYEKKCSSSDLDHAVGLVGFGVDGTTAYWIVRNSWGPSWGENGYIRMTRNKSNNCGVATDCVIPQVQ